MQLKGKVAVVTGGGRGIGRAIARAYGREGAWVVVSGRTKAALDQVVNEIVAAGGNALAMRCDVSDTAQVEALISGTVRTFGRIDILVNNAGVGMPIAPAEQHQVKDFPASAWDEMMVVNLRGTFLCTKAALAPMIEQRSGNIITLTTGLAENPRPGVAPYAASKAGIECFTRCLALEVKEYGIACNIFSPGGSVATQMSLSMPRQGPTRLLDPEACGPAALWLAQQSADTCTGQHIEALQWNQEHGIPVRWHPTSPSPTEP